MAHRATTIRVAGAAVAVAALLAGCGFGGGTTAAPATSTAAPTAASRAPSVAAPTSAAASGAQTPVPPESNPPGDIPDTVAFVAYRNVAGRYTFTHPEGWTQAETGASVTLTDKLNGVHVEPGTLTAPPTVAGARSTDVPLLRRSQPAFELRTIGAASVPSGTGVRVVYRRNSAPDQVTGRVYRDEVERYEIVSGGREVVMELFGPVGADNVDAYRTMVESLRLS